jgi:hypothetical protein
MAHLAMWEGPGDGNGPESEWGEHVTEGVGLVQARVRAASYCPVT